MAGNIPQVTIDWPIHHSIGSFESHQDADDVIDVIDVATTGPIFYIVYGQRPAYSL